MLFFFILACPYVGFTYVGGTQVGTTNDRTAAKCQTSCAGYIFCFYWSYDKTGCTFYGTNPGTLTIAIVLKAEAGPKLC